MTSSTRKRDLRDFLKSSCYQCHSPNSVYMLFSRSLLGKAASQNEYARGCEEVNFLKARRGLLCTGEVGNICQASSAFKNRLCRLQTLRGIPQRCIPDSSSENRKYFHWDGVRPNQLESLWWEITDIKNTGKQVWTLQKLAKARSLTCIENHCIWESGKQLKQLYMCNNVLGQVTVQLGPFILSHLYIPSFLVLARTAY